MIAGNVVTVAWLALAALLVVLAVRVSLCETVWRGYRLHRRTRRMVRGLDALVGVLAATLVAGLAAVMLPALLAG